MTGTFVRAPNYSLAILLILSTTFIVPAHAKSSISAKSEEFQSKIELDKFKSLLPNHILSLDLILARSFLYSEKFKQVESQSYGIAAPALQGEALFDTQLTVSQNWNHDKSDTRTSFSPTSTKANGLSATVGRSFTTGTSLSATVSQSRSDIAYPVGMTSYGPYESKAAFTLSQNLWADSFGAASRRGLKAAYLTSEALKIDFKGGVEKWAIEMVNTYYGAWLMQSQAKAAQDLVRRKERLLNVTKLRLNRGNAEKPDVLQIESAVLQSKNIALSAKQKIDDLWRELILQLKFPSESMAIDSLDVPLALDEVLIEGERLCFDFRNHGVPGSESSIEKVAELNAERAKLLYEKAKSEAWPDLKLMGSYSLNGVNFEHQDSWRETTSSDHPGWAVGLTLSLPLGFSLQKSKVSAAKSQSMLAEAVSKVTHDDRNLAWINECANFDRLKKSRELLLKAFQNQSTRADLEEKRFQLGRSSTFNVIQAGDDSTEAEMNWRTSEVHARQSAWRLLLLDNKVIAQLKSYVSKIVGSLDSTALEKLEKIDAKVY